MGSLSLEEIKKVELDALCELDRVCKAHGLSYFLAYGTLLGALRHQRRQIGRASCRERV